MRFQNVLKHLIIHNYIFYHFLSLFNQFFLISHHQQIHCQNLYDASIYSYLIQKEIQNNHLILLFIQFHS